MNEIAFRGQLADWLNRELGDKAIQVVPSLQVIVATDRGLTRLDNQDRVAIMRVNSNKIASGMLAIAVADGMGGMRDGARCASIAIASFFEALLSNQEKLPEYRVDSAVSFSNRCVYEFSQSHGGATLSAIVCFEGGAIVSANVGDSRIYSFKKGAAPTRLTVDDSMEEAVGGYGRGLLQYIGMGDGIQAHIKRLIPDQAYLMTTDGLHFVEKSTFEKVIANSPNHRSVSERISALARWCGSPDNASSAIFDPAEIQFEVNPTSDPSRICFEFWDSFASLQIIPATSVGHGGVQNVSDKMAERLGSVDRNNHYHNRPKQSRSPPRKRKIERGKTRPSPQEPAPEVQFEIDVGHNQQGPNDDDRQ